MKIDPKFFPDFPALKQLSNSLWSLGTLKGAAVLVGAGLSRGAQLPSSDSSFPPLWTDLARLMAIDLYGSSDADEVPSDPLRLAEEYRISLGNAALKAFIEKHIADQAWQPGPIHSDLLDLPWADVLTTNYDTLLERAALESSRGYEVVRRESDLAHSRSPRILKLHGSVEDGADVVISEEDYRTYPARHAPFVNTARQVFIENELCLLGFSGDDPNFLQWAGWVRDNLGGESRRIYLVGALNLAPVKRRLLESRNIIPIDFGPTVDGHAIGSHARAAELFLTFLKEARPHRPEDWDPASHEKYPSGEPENWSREFSDPDHAVTSLRHAAKLWREDRESYPGWLICPSNKRRQIREGSSVRANLELGIEQLMDEEQLDILLELSWRCHVSCQLPDPWLMEIVLERRLGPELQTKPPELIDALAHTILRQARQSNDQTTFEKVRGCLEGMEDLTDLNAIVRYHQCLFARDQLDFAYVEDNVQYIVGDDPMWGLRRGALQYWVGADKNARSSLHTAARDLKERSLRNPESVWLRSRFSWIHLLSEFLRWGDEGALNEKVQRYYRLALEGYDPRSEFRQVGSRIDEASRKRKEEREIVSSFDAGRFRDNSRTVRFGSSSMLEPRSELSHLSEIVGIPISAESVDIQKTTQQIALTLEFEPTLRWHLELLSTQPSFSKDIIGMYFHRIALARLPLEVVTELVQKVEAAIAFWRPRVSWSDDHKLKALQAVRLFVEVLSRISILDTPELAARHVRFADDLACDSSLKHFWLHEQIGNLLKRSFEAVPRFDRPALSVELLRFPLQAEKLENGPSQLWPDIASQCYQFIRRSGIEEEFDARIAKFIEHVHGDGPSRSEAAVRLLFLHEQNQLTKAQSKVFALALWSHVLDDEAKLPDGLDLYPHSFLIAPSPSAVQAKKRVYRNIFAKCATADPTSLVAAVSIRHCAIKPKASDAARIFRNVTTWRPEERDLDPISQAMTGGTIEERGRVMAAVLAVVAIPHLKASDRTVDRVTAALTFQRETGFFDVLRGLGYFYGVDPESDDQIADAYRQAISGGNNDAIYSAADGLDRWLKLVKANKHSEIPPSIIAQVLTAFERQLPSGFTNFTYVVGRFVEEGMFSEDEMKRVTQVLDELLISTAYDAVDLESRLAVTASLVRAECIRLAKRLHRAGVQDSTVKRWLDLTETDPLPEVRSALENM